MLDVARVCSIQNKQRSLHWGAAQIESSDRVLFVAYHDQYYTLPFVFTVSPDLQVFLVRKDQKTGWNYEDEYEKCSSMDDLMQCVKGALQYLFPPKGVHHEQKV